MMVTNKKIYFGDEINLYLFEITINSEIIKSRFVKRYLHLAIACSFPI